MQRFCIALLSFASVRQNSTRQAFIGYDGDLALEPCSISHQGLQLAADELFVFVKRGQDISLGSLYKIEANGRVRMPGLF